MAYKWHCYIFAKYIFALLFPAETYCIRSALHCEILGRESRKSLTQPEDYLLSFPMATQSRFVLLEITCVKKKDYKKIFLE